MGLSATAIDILRQLPSGSLVCADNDKTIVARVPPDTVLTQDQMHSMERAIVELDTCLIRVLLDNDEESSLPTSPRPCPLTGCTISERHAVDMAKSMGCIDTDHLVPSYAITTSSGRTSLRISRLLKVDDSCLAKYMSTHATGYEYHFGEKQVRIYFEATKKRKCR